MSDDICLYLDLAAACGLCPAMPLGLIRAEWHQTRLRN